ncbi:uncharacterized protein EV422DRAFT_171713 [Fimicolochytrium jonesii]|uniref:uncharacterized protein n=1 Tax=Fimicolochytrium jonesii TaxID=1396493 RepID=UPI0022FDB424|nr:uncharacterized protein EV422DRAFT_171713 [Fimicolochytrium jonesii]KAI8818555.1 hypothetical protein EV422DRAFT_171713 [Fimicolochytrium jonesii]
MEPQDGGHRDTHKVQPLSKANVARIQVDKQEHLSFILDYVRQQSDLVKPRPPDRPATIPSLELEAACPTAGKSKKVHAMKGKDGSILSSVRISPLRPSNLRAKKQLQVEQMERLEQETMESAHLEHVEEPIPIHELPPEDVEIAQPQPVPASPRREPLALVPAEERNKAKRLSKGLERGKPSSTVIDDPLESSVNQKPSKNKITGKIPQKLERKFGSETTSNISSENDAFKVLKKSTKKTIKETKAARGEKVGKADRKKGNALATKVMETFHSDQVTRGRLTRKANDSQRRLGMFNKGVRSEKVHLGRVGNLAFDEAEFLADHPTRLAHAPRKPAVETGVMISDYFQQQPAALAKRPKETSNAQKRTMTEVDAGTSFVSHAEDPDPPSPVEIDCGLESGVGVANTTPSPPKRRPAQAYKVEVVIESDPRKKVFSANCSLGKVL